MNYDDVKINKIINYVKENKICNNYVVNFLYNSTSLLPDGYIYFKRVNDELNISDYVIGLYDAFVSDTERMDKQIDNLFLILNII